MFLSKNNYQLSLKAPTLYVLFLRVCARDDVWSRVPMPLPLPIGAEGHCGREAYMTLWGMVVIPL